MHQQANHLPYLWGESIDDFEEDCVEQAKLIVLPGKYASTFGIKLYATRGFTFLCFSFLSFELNDLQN